MTYANSRQRSILALVVLTLGWGYAWVLSKIALQHVAPFAFSAHRSLLGAIFLFLIVRISGRSMRLLNWKMTAVIGLVQTGLFLIFQTWTLVVTGSGKTAVLVYTMPIWTLMLARCMIGERINRSQLVAALVTLVGLVLMIEPWSLNTGALGATLGILAAACWALGTVMVKMWREHLNQDLLVFTAWQMLFGATALGCVAILVPESKTDWSLEYVAILLGLAIVSYAVCWFLWLYVLEHLPAWQASLSILGVPVVALLTSRLQLEEVLSASEMAGVLLIGAGLLMLSLINAYRARQRLYA